MYKATNTTVVNIAYCLKISTDLGVRLVFNTRVLAFISQYLINYTISNKTGKGKQHGKGRI